MIRDQQVAFAEMFGQDAGKPGALAVRKRNLEHVATKIEHACHGHRHPGIGACPQRGVGPGPDRAQQGSKEHESAP